MLARQRERLVDLIEADFFALIRSDSNDDSESKNEKWNDIAAELNLLGPPFKTGVEWEAASEYIIDAAKQKVLKLRQHRNGTGGGSSSKINVSEWERKIIALHGKNHFDGHQSLNEIAFPNRRIEPILTFNSIQDGPSSRPSSHFDEIEILSDDEDEFSDAFVNNSNACMSSGSASQCHEIAANRALSTSTTGIIKRLPPVKQVSSPSDRFPVDNSSAFLSSGLSNQSHRSNANRASSTSASENIERLPPGQHVSRPTGQSNAISSEKIKRVSVLKETPSSISKKPKMSKTLSERLNEVREKHDKKPLKTVKESEGLRNKPTSYEMGQAGLSQQRDILDQSNRHHKETTDALRALTSVIEKLVENKG